MPIELPASSRQEPKPPRAVTGGQVLVALIAFFTVIIGVNMVMMTLAIRTMPGIEVRSAYEASQRFNRELEAIVEQDQRGWQVDVATGALRHGKLAVDVRDKAGAALAGLDVQVRLERPTDARMDRRLTLVAIGDGRYEAAVPDLARGQWLVTVEIREAGERRFLSQRRIELRG